jgi:hypothetical protein
MRVNPPTRQAPKIQSSKDLVTSLKHSVVWGKEWLTSKRFALIDLTLGSVANPVQPDHNQLIRAIRFAADSVQPIVVDLNKKEIGIIRSFCPKVVVVHGSEIYAAAEIQGRSTVKAWIGIDAAKALKINIKADHDIGVEELRSTLSSKLTGKFKPIATNGISDAWISDIFPFENYFIYKRTGKDWRQAYSVDSGRNIAFVGAPVEVRETYVDAARIRAGDKGIRVAAPATKKVKREVPLGTPDNAMDAKKPKKVKKMKADGDEEDEMAASQGLRQPLYASAVMAHGVRR